MPYEIVKSGSKFVLRKKDGGKVMGRHNTRAGAERQRRAIHANEKGKR